MPPRRRKKFLTFHDGYITRHTHKLLKAADLVPTAQKPRIAEPDHTISTSPTFTDTDTDTDDPYETFPTTTDSPSSSDMSDVEENNQGAGGNGPPLGGPGDANAAQGNDNPPQGNVPPPQGQPAGDNAGAGGHDSPPPGSRRNSQSSESSDDDNPGGPPPTDPTDRHMRQLCKALKQVSTSQPSGGPLGKQILSTFDGSISQDPVSFMTKFCNFKEFSNWGSRKACKAFWCLMTGSASTWCSGLPPDVRNNWTALEKAFRTKYGSNANNKFALHNMLQKLKMKQGESVADFSERVHTLAERLAKSPQDQVVIFLQGLPSRLREVVSAHRPTDLAAATEIASSVEGSLQTEAEDLFPNFDPSSKTTDTLVQSDPSQQSLMQFIREQNQVQTQMRQDLDKLNKNMKKNTRFIKAVTEHPIANNTFSASQVPPTRQGPTQPIPPLVENSAHREYQTQPRFRNRSFQGPYNRKPFTGNQYSSPNRPLFRPPKRTTNTSAPPGGRYANVQCWLCSELGHLQRNCPSRHLFGGKPDSDWQTK